MAEKVCELVKSGGKVNYSTTEQTVGTWIDGKPIYRKVIQTTTPSTNTNTVVATISNLDTLVSLTGFYKNGTQQEPFYFLFGGAGYSSGYVDNGQIYQLVDSSRTNLPEIIVVEYTKL